MHLSPSSALRPPDWRWRLAVRLAQGRHPTPRRWCDPWVRLARRFARTLLCRPEVDGRRGLPRGLEALEEAHRLYLKADSFCRWVVEARLLAGEGFDQVAEKCGLRASAVEAYHALFFDVRGSLRSIDYISTVVIGPKRHVGLTAVDADVILKLFAYGGGPLVLDAAVRFFRHPLLLPLQFDGLEAADLAELRSQLLVKASILVLTIPADARNLRKLAALQDTLQGLAGPGANDALAAGVLQGAVQFEADLAQALAASPAGASGAAAAVDQVEVGGGDPATSAA
jgi:hypothetical protein